MVRMRKRASVDKNEYGTEREAKYRRLCEVMAYNAGIQLEKDAGAVYRMTEAGREIVCRAVKSKTLWYETFVALKDKGLADDPPFHKNPFLDRRR